ncbi:MAG: hypothetical protein AAF614_43990, partial [Chloroflexota bacterium]
VRPVSNAKKPACIIKTSIALIKTQIMSLVVVPIETLRNDLVSIEKVILNCANPLRKIDKI